MGIRHVYDAHTRTCRQNTRPYKVIKSKEEITDCELSKHDSGTFIGRHFPWQEREMREKRNDRSHSHRTNDICDVNILPSRRAELRA